MALPRRPLPVPRKPPQQHLQRCCRCLRTLHTTVYRSTTLPPTSTPHTPPAIPADHLPWAAAQSAVPDAFRRGHQRDPPPATPPAPLPITPADIPVIPFPTTTTATTTTASPPPPPPPPHIDTGERWDVVVVGGGHAGCEAASAAARAGCRTLLLTANARTVGEMSCNPSIGGIGKGVLVREVDALGGEMGVVADVSGLMYKVLNRSRGPAVYGPRAQIDRDLYRREMQRRLALLPALTVREGQVDDVLLSEASEGPEAEAAVRAVVLATGHVIHTRTVVLTTGTFLSGVLHIGPTQRVMGGRYGEDASYGLSHTLRRKLGLRVERLTTATPPRLDGRTIDYRGLSQQWGDEPPQPFSYMNDAIEPELLERQLCSYLTYTSPETHSIIQANAHLLPRNFTANEGKGQGPRYCPQHREEDHTLQRPQLAPHMAGARGPALAPRVPERAEHGLPRRGAAGHAALHRRAGARAYGEGRVRGGVRLCGLAAAAPYAGGTRVRRAVPGRADQRHDGVRGGGRAGRHGRHQRGAQSARPGRLGDAP